MGTGLATRAHPQRLIDRLAVHRHPRWLIVLALSALATAWAEDPPPTEPAPTPPPSTTDPNPQAGDTQAAQRSPSATAQSKEPPPAAEEWPRNTLHTLSLQSERLSEAIFDLLDDIDLVKVHVGDGTLGVRAGRRIFDNHNVLGSWTVVDHIRVSLSHPFYSVSWPIAGTLTGGFSIGGEIGNDFIDIRQVLPRDYAKLEPIGDRAKAAEESDWIKGLPADSDSGQTLAPPDHAAGDDSERAAKESQRPQREIDQAFDGLTKARYSKLWNIISFPIRIPSQADWIGHLQDGEVISFTARGTISMGPSVSWMYDVSQVTNSLTAGASVAIYVNGQFRISIMRESARFARIRLTRIAEIGTTASLNGETDDVVEGYTIVNAHIGRGKSAVKPFSFSFSHAKGRAFDLAYRYDLSQAAGRMAYESAAAGRFDLSDEVAGGSEWQHAPENCAVHRIGTRTTQFSRDAKQSSSRYGIIYRHSHESSVTNSNIVATFPEGTSRVYRTVVENGQQWRFIWGVFERVSHNFRFNVDLDRAQRGQPEALTLVVEGDITDTDTSGDEMHEYIDEVEGAAMKPGFFPRPPKQRPLEDFPAYRPDNGADRRRADDDQRHREGSIDYYRSSFFYQLTYSEEQIDHFVETPEERMWPALERAFDVTDGTWSTPAKRFSYALANTPVRILNIPLYAINLHYREGSILQHAQNVHDAWAKAQRETVLIRRIAALGEMFSDRRYGRELSRLMRAVLAGEQTTYVIQGSSHVFGYLREEGVATTAIDPLPERKERRIEFDREGPRPQADPEAAIKSLSVTALIDGRIRVAFSIPENDQPQALYVSLLAVRPWKLTRIVGQQAILNTRGVISGGDNVLLLSQESGLLANLFSQIVPGNSYVLKVAYTRDGLSWGPVAETRFEMRKP